MTNEELQPMIEDARAFAKALGLALAEDLNAGFPLGPTDEQMGFGRPWDQPEPRLTWDLKHLRQPVLDPACICLDPEYHTIPF